MLLSALRCLARKDGRNQLAGGASERSIVKLRGEINAARLWASLRRTRSGRVALAAAAKRRARITVHPGDPSRIILRHAHASKR